MPSFTASLAATAAAMVLSLGDAAPATYSKECALVAAGHSSCTSGVAALSHGPARNARNTLPALVRAETTAGYCKKAVDITNTVRRRYKNTGKYVGMGEGDLAVGTQSMLDNAFSHSKKMADGFGMNHQDLSAASAAVGCDLFINRENIAMFGGFGDTDPAEKCMKQWEDSPPHLDNIMGAKAGDYVVIGVYENGNEWWCTQTFAPKKDVNCPMVGGASNESPPSGGDEDGDIPTQASTTTVVTQASTTTVFTLPPTTEATLPPTTEAAPSPPPPAPTCIATGQECPVPGLQCCDNKTRCMGFGGKTICAVVPPQPDTSTATDSPTMTLMDKDTSEMTTKTTVIINPIGDVETTGGKEENDETAEDEEFVALDLEAPVGASSEAPDVASTETPVVVSTEAPADAPATDQNTTPAVEEGPTSVSKRGPQAGCNSPPAPTQNTEGRDDRSWYYTYSHYY